MFRKRHQRKLHFVVNEANITRAGPYDTLRETQVAAAGLNLRASRSVAAG
jgi:hypothetical protein